MSSRKSPEKLFPPSQRPPESFPTTPPEISRFPFGTKVIKILDLSLYLQPTRPFTVSSTLSYSPKPVFPIPQSLSFTNHATRQNPLLSFINLPARLSSSHPVLQQHSSVQFITNHATRPNPLLSFINLLARLSSSHPVLRQHSSVQVITSYNYQVRFPDSSLHCSPSVWQFRTRRAGNCTEFEAVSTYVTLKKNNLHHLKES